MKVHQLLSGPEKWCRSAMALDKDGESVSWRSPTAVRFCLLGAIARCYAKEGGAYEEVTNKVSRELEVRQGIGCISVYNDDIYTSFEDVKSLVTELDI
jgi:hypothetical protein